ncbi:MAG: transposase family protein, partial [Patescibacteria group bacterium]
KDKGALSKEDILLIVDATEQETEKREGTGYSGKKRKQTIKTQVIAGQDGKIRYVSPSVSGNIHDKKLFDMTSLPKRIQQRMLADLGYVGTDCIIPEKSSKLHILTAQQKKDNKKHSILRIPIEHLFAHLKQWKILASRFRSSLKNYNIIFRIVCGLRNMMIA